ncbi:hypothetical protein ACROYT_G041569 [Oculina patagonica]
MVSAQAQTSVITCMSYLNQDMLWPDGQAGLHADFAFLHQGSNLFRVVYGAGLFTVTENSLVLHQYCKESFRRRTPFVKCEKVKIR